MGMIACICVLLAVFVPGLRTASSAAPATCLSQSAPEQQASSANLLEQSQEQVNQKSTGCVSCHTATDSPTMHTTGTIRLGCTDCHGGHAQVLLPPGTLPNTAEYLRLTRQAHPQSRIAENAWSSANPVRAYTKWLKEDADYIKFVNPGDLRVAEETCGRSGCHAAEVRRVQTSMMTHGAMLWGAALYNNGAFPLKDPHFGESYGRDGTPQRLQTYPPPTPDETEKKGVLPYLEPLQTLGGVAAGQCSARVRARRWTWSDRRETTRIPARENSSGRCGSDSPAPELISARALRT